MLGRGRTHHYVSKQKSENLSRIPTTAVDHYFLKQKFHCELSDNTTRDSDVHCGEGGQTSKHHEQRSSEERNRGPCSSEIVARFINSSGYKEITLKSDTEQAIIAFRNRVAENCKAEVALEDAVKGDNPSNGWVENAVMLLRGVIRTIQCHVESCTQELREDSPILPWTVGRHSKDCMERSLPKNSYHLARPNIIRTAEQNESQIQVRSVAGSEKHQC